MSSTTNVLITGVTRGLGKALVETYLQRPNHVVVGTVRDLDSSAAKALKSLPTASNSQLILFQLDNASITDAPAGISQLQTSGITHLDMVISNAATMGVQTSADIDIVSPQDLSTCFEVNARGALILFQATKGLLEKGKDPRWVSMSSVSGSVGSIEKFGTNAFSAYGISKAALNWITVAIHVNCKWLTAFALHPGFVQTDGGNASAQAIGMENAPNTVEESIKSIVKLIDQSDRQKSSGQFFDTLSGSEIPW